MLTGSVGIPTLHLVFHYLPHDHIGGGIHYHLPAQSPSPTQPSVAETDDDGDGHDEIPHHHHHQHNRVADSGQHPDTAGGERHDDEREPFDARHGEGSNAHFSLALAGAAATPVVLAIIGPCRILTLSPQRLVAPCSAERATSLVRGPPVTGV